jgi:hypothetical protein
MTETKDDRIQRLIESRSFLYKHIIKFGSITKCHIGLFKKIDGLLEQEGIVLDDDGFTTERKRNQP